MSNLETSNLLKSLRKAVRASERAQREGRGEKKLERSEETEALEQLFSKKQKISSDPPAPTQEEPATTFGYTEINKLEHCARALQKNIRLIVDEAPTVHQLQQYASDESIDRFARSEMKTNTSLRLVARLKSNYKNSQLKIFDEILDNNVSSHGSYGSADGTSESIGDEKNMSGDETYESQEGLPPLPKINRDDLRQRVFQHKSTSANKTYLKDSEIVLTHNERIEFLGDSVLNSVVTFILYKRFPAANEGQLSQIRSLLINNKVLAEFSLAYGFDKKLRCQIEEDTLRDGPQKVYADVFEAYIGALAMERGYELAEVESWLKALMAKKIAVVSKELSKVAPVNREAKTELYSLIGSASSHPIYKVIESGDGSGVPFRVQCIMEGTVLGEGKASSHRVAGLRAAMAALNNKEKLEFYGRKRIETDRSVSGVKQPDSQKKDAEKTSSTFPLVAGETIVPNKFAKTEAYAYFGKNLGLTPEYVAVYEEDERRYKVELRVKDVVVSVAYDVSRKNAVSRAAAVILENMHVLPEIVDLIN